MLRKVRKLGALIMALTMIFVLALGAGAAYYKMPGSADVDGTVVSLGDDAVTIAVEITPGSAKSVNFYLEGDALSREFWNQSGASVEVDISMSTDGDQVYACLPGFTSGWGWVNPTDWSGLLSKGSTTTIRESFSTYYAGGFGSKDPMAIRVQLYTNSTETQSVEVTVSGLRFVGVGDVAEVTTAATTTTAETTTEATTTVEEPVESEPEEEESTESEPSEDATVESDESEPEEEEPAESEPEETTTAATTTVKPEEEDSDRPITTTTQPNQATTPSAPSANDTTTSSSNDSNDGGGFLGPIIIIVIVVVVIAVAVVGVIIYRKKKFY